MNKTFILSVILLGIPFVVGAQEERNPVFTVSVNQVVNDYHEDKASVGNVIGQIASAVLAKQATTRYEGYEDAVRSAVVRGISNTFRLNVVDGALSDSEKAKPGTMYVDAVIDDVSTTQKTNYNESTKKSTTYYMGHLSVVLHFKDAKNDNVLHSPSFNLSEYDCSWLETAEKAISNALNSLSRRVRSYLDKHYPLRANIIEGAREKKDKQKEVYIDLGSNDGVYKGLHFAVYIEKTVAGKAAQKQIGKLRITDVEGEDVSLCKVQSGGRDIKAALDQGLNVVVKTID